MVDSLNNNIAAGGRRNETVVLYLLMLSYAAFYTLIGTFLPRIIADFDVPLAHGGMFISIQNVGGLLGVVLLTPLLDRFGKRRLIRAGYAFLTILLLILPTTRSLAAYLVLLALAGLAAKMLNPLLTARISDMYGPKKGIYINLLHACYGIGCFFVPLLSGLFLEWGYSWRDMYRCLAWYCLAVSLLYLILIRSGRSGGETIVAKAVRAGSAPLDRRLVFLSLALFFYSGYEASLNNWLPTYMIRELGVSPVAAGSGVSAMWLGLILGRFLCSVAIRFAPERTLIAAGAVLAAAVMTTGFAAGGEIPLYLGVGGAGVLAGAQAPMVFTLAWTWFPGRQGKASLAMFGGITVGAVLLPWLMGLVGGAIGLRNTMLLHGLPLLLSGLMALFLPKAEKRKD